MFRDFFIKFIIIFFILIQQGNLYSQSNSSFITKNNTAVLKQIQELEKSIKIEDDPSLIALKYEELSDELMKINAYSKAQKYLNKALEYYKEINDVEKTAKIYRKLARLYELQSSNEKALENYSLSNSISSNSQVINLNKNDITRIKNPNDPDLQIQMMDSNISILKKEGKLDEVAQAYKEKAIQQLKNKDTTGALLDLENALTVIHDDVNQKTTIQSELAKIYQEKKETKKAVQTIQLALEEAKKLNRVDQIIELNNQLAQIYLKSARPDSGLIVLEKNYEFALNRGKTFDVAAITRHTANYYAQIKDYDLAIQQYQKFQEDLSDLIYADSSLTNAKLFQVTEDKIEQLEKEKVLKDQMIKKQNRFNYFLIGLSTILLILILIVGRSIWIVRKRNRKIALQSLRREMNPHFIFNSLNSVNQFIAENNEKGANLFLTSYSQLMRNFMENSGKDFIPLSSELELVEQYLQLEHLRFENKFDYSITIDDDLSKENCFFPNMLIQPHLENSVWHGLRYLEGKGKLLIEVKNTPETIIVVISDNGIGRSKSKELKTVNQRNRSSRGIKNVKERIQLLNQLYGTAISMEIYDNKDSPGTTVLLRVKKTNRK